MSVKLSLANLKSLPAGISRPNYQREALSPGIVHIGVGNFHRAHEAVFMDRLFNKGRDMDWAIIGAGVKPADQAMHDALAAQDLLTTVVEQEATLSTARVTGSMIGFVPPSDKAGLLRCLTDPSTRIVSMTITEGGYYIDPATGVFNPEDPDIRSDAANPEAPSTAFGILALALKRRRDAGITPFTVMSCDNIPHNGVVARNAVSGVARLYDAGLADWIVANTAFPNAMVDRIVPATTDRERRLLAADFGIQDNWPVYCEEYIQWVLEDTFCNGRPALEDVGVTFVSDVTPFEFMKIRILNGGHAAIAYPGRLLDVHFVHEAMEHPLIGGFFARLEREEIIPTVPPVPGVVLGEYYELIRRRFLNPKIGDTIPRLAFDGSNRQPKFIVPVARDRLKAGGSINGLALESALWCRHCAGTSESGKTIEPADPSWPRLAATAQAAKDRPEAWLDMGDIYGDVGQNQQFRQAFAGWLRMIWSSGTARTLETYIHA